MKAFRIAHPRHATRAEAFGGRGAFLFPGRWHNPGCRIVYCAESLALATLESMAHLDSPKSLRGFFWFAIELPDDLVETPAVLPDGWNARPGEAGYLGAVSARFGTAWYQERRSLALKVPSAVVPSEHNLLVNPLHPKFDLSAVEGPFPVIWDERLV